MKASVQARLDKETQAALDRVMKRYGWTASKVVREGLRMLLREHEGSAASKMVGIGIFASGVKDMGSNKKYLEGFGENSGIDRRRADHLKRKAG